jgi:hypothetical protein
MSISLSGAIILIVWAVLAILIGKHFDKKSAANSN